MGTGDVDLEVRKDIHTTTGGVVYRAHRTLGGQDIEDPSEWWNEALEALLRGQHLHGPQAVARTLAKHRPDLRAWVDALPDEERELLLTTGWAPPKPQGDPGAVPPAP